MKKTLNFALLIAGTIIFNLLFWHESIGNNAMLYSIFVLASALFLNKKRFMSLPVLINAGGIIVTSALVAYHASHLAIFVWIMSLVLFPAFIHNDDLKSYVFALPTALLAYFTLPDYLQRIETGKIKSQNARKMWRYLKIGIIPLIILYIFYWIFKFANKVFDEITHEFFSEINDWIFQILLNFSLVQILFLFWGFTITAWFIYKGAYKYFVEKEKSMSDVIVRERRKIINPNQISARRTLSMKLKNEFRIGLLTIILVNSLLLIVNIIDITWIWFDFEYTSDINLSDFVHKGTYLLVFSILLSIGIMLYFFRRNLNFYPKKESLQIVSYIWIAQNVILLISVLIRNLHYINYYGLAYKRIGLFFFLVLVLIFLASLIIKIRDRKTTFYLFRFNSITLYIGFVLFAVPDWDIIIAKYNLSAETKTEIDVDFLLNLDNKTLPYIDQNIEILDKQGRTHKFIFPGDTYKNAYEKKLNEFIETYKEKSWRSRNNADTKAFKYFENKEVNDEIPD